MTDTAKGSDGVVIVPRYNQMGGAMVAGHDTFNGKPAGAWVEAKDYDALAARLADAEAKLAALRCWPDEPAAPEVKP